MKKIILLCAGIFLSPPLCLANDTESLATRANNLFLAEHYNDAITLLTTALSQDPHNYDARLLLIKFYNDIRKFDEAINVIHEGLTCKPNDINLTFVLGNTYMEANRFEEARAIYQHLNEQIPNHSFILYNMAFLLKKMEKLDEAIPLYDKALELNPHLAEAIFSRGLAYLIRGDFEQGWAGYEWRYGSSQESRRTYDKPRWDGSDLNGKTILIHAEQGFGDTFQFIRYAHAIKEKNGIVIAAVQKPLVTLIKRCKYIDKVISTEETVPHFDVYLEMMSLPYILKTRLDTIPCEIPYLYADEQLTDHWKNRLAADKNFKIGICWNVNENYSSLATRTKAAQRSIKLGQLIPLCTIPGTTIYSLQKTTGTEQLENLTDNVKIISFDGDFDQSNGRFMDTAAVIKNLDLVITVDTSIGHLAGGLGANTWIIRQNPPDWRWILNRTDTPWYPTVRLFKQPTPGDWETVIEEVAQELKKYITKKAVL